MGKCEFCKVVETLINDKVGDWRVVDGVCDKCKVFGKIYSAPTSGGCVIKHCETCHGDFLIENPVDLQI
jgi:hypothetical protein